MTPYLFRFWSSHEVFWCLVGRTAGCHAHEGEGHRDGPVWSSERFDAWHRGHLVLHTASPFFFSELKESEMVTRSQYEPKKLSHHKTPRGFIF